MRTHLQILRLSFIKMTSPLNWTLEDVSSWLADNGLENFQQQFMENRIDGATLCGLTERMTERLFPLIRDQMQFIKLLEDVLLRVRYPSHRQYVQLLSMVISNYPVLKERVGSGYDGLHQSLKNKFKKERRPLVAVQEVDAMRKRFGAAASFRKRRLDTSGENQGISRISRQNIMVDVQLGEDPRSVAAHIETLKRESQKSRPNLDLIKTSLLKTQVARKEFLTENTTSKILEEFPCLRIPSVLLGEMKLWYGVNADIMVQSNLKVLSGNLVRAAPNSPEKDKMMSKLRDSLNDPELELNMAILLLPTLFKEDPSFLFAVDHDPKVPTPVVSLKGGERLEWDHINILMDNVAMLIEDAGVDVTLALACLISVYYIYGIEYPSQLKKTFCFLEHFVFKITSSPLPITVRRVYNSLQ